MVIQHFGRCKSQYTETTSKYYWILHQSSYTTFQQLSMQGKFILHKVLCIFPAVQKNTPGTEMLLLVFSTSCWYQESNPGVMGMSPNTKPCSYSAPGIQFYVIQSALTRRNSNTLTKVLRTQQIKKLFHCSLHQPSCGTFPTGSVFLPQHREIIAEC